MNIEIYKNDKKIKIKKAVKIEEPEFIEIKFPIFNTIVGDKTMLNFVFNLIKNELIYGQESRN